MDVRNAILTGVSHGIGSYIVWVFAVWGMNLLLVVCSELELVRFVCELWMCDTKVVVVAIDFAGR